MRRVGQDLIDILKWVGFAPWSLFWMTSAITYGIIFRNDPHTPLSWARRFWSPGAAVISGCQLTRHPGFVPEPRPGTVKTCSQHSSLRTRSPRDDGS